ncbi:MULTISPECIES: hypothetical protein [Bacillaceae]|nr:MULTISPECIES: hypothetical protein [Bacillaceae]
MKDIQIHNLVETLEQEEQKRDAFINQFVSVLVKSVEKETKKEEA